MNKKDILEEELRKDILYQIDMQLYDEFNDKFCEINENLGTVYSYKDLEDLKKAESDTERRLLRQAISTLIAENKELKEFKENIEKIDRKQLDKLYEDAQKALKEYRETQNKVAKLEEENKELKEKSIPKSKLKAKIEELETMYDGLSKNPKEHLHSKTEYKIVIGVLQELLDERNNTDEH